MESLTKSQKKNRRAKKCRARRADRPEMAPDDSQMEVPVKAAMESSSVIPGHDVPLHQRHKDIEWAADLEVITDGAQRVPKARMRMKPYRNNPSRHPQIVWRGAIL
ncbi:hypothetical protein N7491_001660 [Penicillium cf. griseofulvum]|uniref:Uncharacterized protein n=1 Tax=Penicillium cf. griseofulvum TaxID=2972120 RepID=A0A9W9JC42_9EURO|nr:hypothetical protein N7472_006789 [Penicillium cf. griseofulvum]KAJ5445578.1 hypothetical protein N7491_001660 [Penicillium cf. griseofulvum]KAJ5447300.1 hypothetical protein N7445_002121 [Penicillium cf. griseofulvum]